VYLLSKQARAFARFIDSLRTRWFVVTSEKMNDHFEGFRATATNGVASSDEALTSLTDAIESLAELAGGLPHNKRELWPIRIWPLGNSEVES
jgi:hypothetical protein